MRRCLVVANQTLLGGPLLVGAQECLAAGPGQLHPVVPGSHAAGLEPFPGLTSDVVGEAA